MNVILTCFLLVVSTALLIFFGVLLVYGMFVYCGLWWLWLILIFALIFCYRMSIVILTEPDYIII